MPLTVKSLFKRLSYGQLSNLAMAEGAPGTLSEAGQAKVIQAANDALLKLYSRFMLKEGNVLIEMHAHITFYHLVKRFSTVQGHPAEPVHYILDLPAEPFEDDVIKPMKVTDSLGHPLTLNDVEDPWSVHTPQGKILQVSRPFQYRALSVLYQAKHHELTKPEDEIDLPEVLYEALCEYIAYKVYFHMNTPESIQKSLVHEQNFEKICINVVDQDLVLSSISTSNTRFSKNGWK